MTPARRALLEGLLSADERERADRYLVPAPRERFVVARGTLREILGRMSGLPPDRLRFSYPCVCGKPDCAPSRRKPRLELDPGSPPLRFNLAHTEGLATIAVSVGPEVGIDVERVDPGAVIGSIAEHVLGADELASLCALPEAEQVEAFYRVWTRKEAGLKARGSGFAGEPGEAGRWRFHDVPTPPGYVGALAAEEGEWAVSTRWWPEAA